MACLENQKILIGVTGGIAAYKIPELIRRLREQGAQVRVVMTASAQHFITATTLQAVSGHPVRDDLFDPAAEASMGHIELARWADLIVIAPASADCIARLAHGFANDLLTTICLASCAKLIIAPAMNQQMWANTAVQANVDTLIKRDVLIAGPASGEQACGDIGMGRLLEPAELLLVVMSCAKHQQKNKPFLNGVKILITAGPTREAIDPVRYLTNHSSGKMGYALAQAAVDAGAHVTLISGPTQLTDIHNARCIAVESALDMRQAVMERIEQQDIFIGAAAVADYSVDNICSEKIKKSKDAMALTLVRNPDIIAEIAHLDNKPFVVGFAAETNNVIEHARDKLQRKGMDMIIANQVGQGLGFQSDLNEASIINAAGEITALPLQPKMQLAEEIIRFVAFSTGQNADTPLIIK